jgi:hypothetical protein
MPPKMNATKINMGGSEETHRELGAHRQAFLFLLFYTNLERMQDVPVGRC